jgi:hypothetical protein
MKVCIVDITDEKELWSALLIDDIRNLLISITIGLDIQVILR